MGAAPVAAVAVSSNSHHYRVLIWHRLRLVLVARTLDRAVAQLHFECLVLDSIPACGWPRASQSSYRHGPADSLPAAFPAHLGSTPLCCRPPS